MSFQDRVLQGARRKCVADHFDREALLLQGIAQRIVADAAVYIDERIVRPHLVRGSSPEFVRDELAIPNRGRLQMGEDLPTLTE